VALVLVLVLIIVGLWRCCLWFNCQAHKTKTKTKTDFFIRNRAVTLSGRSARMFLLLSTNLAHKPKTKPKAVTGVYRAAESAVRL
jgi:hypothetical protein